MTYQANRHNDVAHEEGTASISRAAALRPSVPLYRHMLYGSGLSHPVDFLVLSHIHFMCEDGRDFTVDEVVTALRDEGVRNSNGKGDGLIGSKAVYESVGRIRAAGFLHRVQGNGGRFGRVAYTFYEFPSQNPHWTPSESSDSDDNLPLPLTGEAVPASNSVSAGGTASPHKARADKGSADRRSGRTPVSAGHSASPHRRSGSVSPPTPPPEEEVKPPPPPTPSSTVRSLPSQREEEGPDFSTEEIDAAARFLQRMDRWQAGAKTARRCATRLLRTMRAQEWPALVEMSDEQRKLLESEVLRNTGGAKSWDRCLGTWVEDLRLYTKVRSRGSAGGGLERCPDHPRRYREGCPDCALTVPA